jgi:Fe-S-cluster containining protein
MVVPPGGTCAFLGPQGCTLDELRPLHCRLYPLVLLPGDALGIDMDCHCSQEYLSQLSDLRSDARHHLKRSRQEISSLGENDKNALCDWGRYLWNVTLVGD